MQLSLVLKGIRPKTLVAAFVPPVTAFALYYRVSGDLSLVYLFLCLGLALFIQMATNFYNDAVDFLKGADDKRVGPARITTQHKVSVKSVFRLGHMFLLLAFICGVPLVLKGGAVVAIFGLLSLFLAYGYTGGPFPLAYLGLGELFVFLFFGLVATCGSYFIFAAEVSFEVVLLGTQLGLLSSVLIAINNYRDRISDKEIGKNTLATKMTNKNYLLMIDGFLFIPYLISLYFVFFTSHLYLLNLISMFFAIKIRNGLRGGADGEMLNNYLALSGKHLLFFSLIYSGVSFWI